MSRYSALWRTTGRDTPITPDSRSTDGFFYPPLTPTGSPPPPLPSTIPKPHPYQLAGLYSPTSTLAQSPPSFHPSSSSSAAEKQPHGHHIERSSFPHSSLPNVSRPSSPKTSNAPLPLPATPKTYFYQRSIILVFIILLPIPPLLSTIYFVIGHLIASHTHASLIPRHHPSLLTSANLGATGGAILSLPFLLLSFLLYRLIPSARRAARLQRWRREQRPTADDFFESDDEEEEGLMDESMRAVRMAMIGLGALMFVGVGTIAAPLGVVCLGNVGGWTPGRAAEVAALGGAVVGGGILIAGLVWKLLSAARATS